MGWMHVGLPIGALYGTPEPFHGLDSLQQAESTNHLLVPLSFLLKLKICVVSYRQIGSETDLHKSASFSSLRFSDARNLTTAPPGNTSLNGSVCGLPAFFVSLLPPLRAILTLSLGRKSSFSTPGPS